MDDDDDLRFVICALYICSSTFFLSRLDSFGVSVLQVRHHATSCLMIVFYRHL